MRFEESNFFNGIPSKKVVFPFGDFYFTEHFILSELKEGIHFDEDKKVLLLDVISEYYKDNMNKLAYISNRVHPYSVEPQVWKSKENTNFPIASAIVYYSNFSFINASLEKHFSKNSLKRCASLEEAISWIQNLREFD